MSITQKRGVAYFLTVLTLFLLLAGFFAPTAAASEELAQAYVPKNNTIRVGYFPMGEFMKADEDGNISGYNTALLDAICNKTGWSYTFVECSSMREAGALLKNDEIDLLAPVPMDVENIDNFVFSSVNIAIQATAIYTKTEHTEWLYEDFDAMSSLTYGVVGGSTSEAGFTNAYCFEHSITPKIVEYNSYEEMLAALKNGSVDAIIANAMYAPEGTKMLGRFSIAPVYYITTEDKSSLMNEVNEALLSIIAEDPYFISDLRTEYFPISDRFNITYEEQQFVDALPVLKVGYETNHAPLSYTDENTGEFAGITRDILDRITEISGIRFEYVPLPTEGLTYDYLQRNGIYLLSDMAENAINLSDSQLAFSDVYLETDKVYVTKASSYGASETTIARVTGSNTLVSADNIDADFTFHDYETIADALSSVQSGETDCLVINRYAAEAALDNPNYSDLKILPTSSLSDDRCLAMVSFYNDVSGLSSVVHDELFLSVLNKAIVELDTADLDAIILENTSTQYYEYSFSDLMKAYWLPICFIIFLLLVCIVLLVIARRAEITKKRAIQYKNDELAQKNQALTDSLAEVKLSNNVKNQFFSRMSHKIRTPLNAMQGLIELAQSYANDPQKVNDCLQKVSDSSQVLVDILNDLLDVSAIETSKLRITKSEFDVKQLLSGVTSLYSARCKNKGVELIVDVDVSRKNIVGDPMRVSQILMELMSNAYKYTDEGGSITLRITQTDVRGNQVDMRMIVSDTGRGMSKDTLSRLFKPVALDNKSALLQNDSTGLGLLIVKNLVDMMQGNVKAESAEGRGTTFTVDIPFEVLDPNSPAYPERLNSLNALNADNAQMPDTFDFSGHKLLFAEDNALNAEITIELLKLVNMEVDHVSNGREAVEAFKNSAPGTYSLILMDIQMPEMDGYKAARLIRSSQHEEASTIPIFAMTANAFTEDVSKSLACGMNGHISKPIDTVVLYQTIYKTINKCQVFQGSARIFL